MNCHFRIYTVWVQDMHMSQTNIQWTLSEFPYTAKEGIFHCFQHEELWHTPKRYSQHKDPTPSKERITL